jgi:hypothetical protein
MRNADWVSKRLHWGGGMMVDDTLLIECESFRDLFVSCTDGPPHRCSPQAVRFGSWEEVWLPFRRASLLPFVRSLECSLGGP